MAIRNAIIIGGGAGGICMAHTLKWKLHYHDFEVYDKREGLGGTWRANTYPGCGSDVPIHLYSFSFNLNPEWTQALAEQDEILRYFENTVDKFDLRQHFRFSLECVAAKWENGLWHVTFVNTRTGEKVIKQCRLLLTAVGGFSQPRRVKFPGMESFGGHMFHTAEWDHSFDWRGKRVAVIGNGCSAAQVVPSIAKGVTKLTQYARSPQWYHERPNKPFSRVERFCFRYLPLWQRYYRLDLFLKIDELASVYGPSEWQVKERKRVEQSAREYIYKSAPERYHNFIVPDFPLGCKRRIYDPGYLKSLHYDHVDLLPEGIKEITATGIISESGKAEDFDAIVLATGFDVTSFLTPLAVTGKNGASLQRQWGEHRGAQAYMGTFVHNFPNFAIIFGPNTFPAFNSVIYAIEVQVAYISKALVKPIIDGYGDEIDVKPDAEETFIIELDKVLDDTVFSAGCSNWYINGKGRNSAAWPGSASSFWKATFFPQWNNFDFTGGSSLWLARKAWRNLFTSSGLTMISLSAGLTVWGYKQLSQLWH